MHLSVALQDEIWGTVGGSKFCWRSSAACALLAKPLRLWLAASTRRRSE